MNYQIISEEDILNVLLEAYFDIVSPIRGIINLVDIARIKKTSRYQVKKHINKLLQKDLVKLSYKTIDSEKEIFPPYWGYSITEKATKTNLCEEIQKKNAQLIKECFEMF